MVNAMFLSPGLSHGMWGKAIISATYLLDKIHCKENKIVLMNYGLEEDYLIIVLMEIGKSSRIDDEVVQDQRQRDDNDLQDERQDQPKEEEVEPRRSKRARTEKSFGPDFVSFMVENEPTSYREAPVIWDDLVMIWNLVKEIFSSTEPTDDEERTVWGELKRLFEPNTDDILWKLQRYMNDPLKWRLYDTCRVHHLSIERGTYIFMLVEKEYPLSKGVLTLMLVNRLLVEQHSEMANELLRKIFIQANRPRQ
ncbi:hypothetical protein Tco_0485280 [Tanacetum coccineum]